AFVFFEELRTDVGLSADSGCIAELFRGGDDGVAQLALALGSAGALPLHRQSDRAEERSGPSAEVLRGVILADDRLNVVVDVAVLDVDHAITADELEKLSTFHVLELRHDR